MGMYDAIKKSGRKKSQETSVSVIKELTNIKTLSAAVRPLGDSSILAQKRRHSFNIDRFGFESIDLFDLYKLYRYADILQIIFNTKARETFRNGLDIRPKHQRASLEQQKRINILLNKANNNGQSLIEVFKEFCKDLDWADDAYLLVSKDYLINEEGDIIGGDVREIIRLNPLTVEMVLDSSNKLGFQDKAGGQSIPVYFDIKTRMLTEDKVNLETGIPNLQAHYKVLVTSGEYKYYNSSEILHKSEHNPSITYGLSPLFALTPKILTLVTQDDYIRKYYGENKPPKGFLMFNTDNVAGLNKAMDEIRVKARQDPHQVYPLVFENRDNRDPVKYIDMSRNLQEMQFTESRNEFRNQIGAVYGVSPVFQNDTSTSGGLNNEGLQITVTNRAVEDKQSIFNNFLLPFIFEQNLGITDWEIKLFPSEEQDDAHELDLETKELQNVKLKLELGMKGAVDENGKFTFNPGELSLETPTNEFIPFGQSEDFATDENKELKVITDIDKRVSKATGQLPKKVEQEFKTSLDKELEKIVKQLDLQKKPDEGTLKATVDKLAKNFDKQLKAKSANRIRKIYQKAMKKVGIELNKDFTIQQKDKNIIEALKRDPVFEGAFKNTSLVMSVRLKDVITKAYDNPKGFTIDNLVKDMREELDKSNSDLRRIARTETSKINLAARKVSYEKTGDLNTMKFKVIGPNDKRTGIDSKEIIKLVGDGKNWDEIVSIIQKVADKRSKGKWTVNKDAPIPRPNWRHVIVKVV